MNLKLSNEAQLRLLKLCKGKTIGKAIKMLEIADRMIRRK